MAAEVDLRILSDDGDMTIVSVTELTSNTQSLPDRVVDAIEAEFDADDDIAIKR